MIKNLFKFNKTVVKQSSFIRLVIVLMQFSDIFLNKQVTYEHVLAIKKPIHIIEKYEL